MEERGYYIRFREETFFSTTILFVQSVFTHVASIYANLLKKSKRLQNKRVRLSQDEFGTPTTPPFHCFGSPIWPLTRHLKALDKRIIHNTSDWLAECGISIEMTRRVWGNPSKHGKHLSSRVCTYCQGSYIQPDPQRRPLFSYKVFYSNVSETMGGDSAVILIDKFSLFCVSFHPFNITSSRHKYSTKCAKIRPLKDTNTIILMDVQQG